MKEMAGVGEVGVRAKREARRHQSKSYVPVRAFFSSLTFAYSKSECLLWKSGQDSEVVSKEEVVVVRKLEDSIASNVLSCASDVED